MVVVATNRHTAVGAGALLVLSPALIGCDRIGNDPIHWLGLVIAIAAGIVFWLQLLKDW